MTASPTDDLASAERRNQELTKELLQARGELAESREQQAATADILRVISRSPADLEPVLDTLVKSAAKFCSANDVVIYRLNPDGLRVIAHYGPIRGPVGLLVPSGRTTVTGRCVLERRPIHVADYQAETKEYPDGSAIARELGFHTIASVPLVREVEPIGAILLRRTNIAPFSEKQIELLKTFADQAVIAIENTRLFEAEQARTRELTERTQELTEALEYQTATSDVLAVISRSKFELQPVLDTIGEIASRLCAAEDVTIFLLENTDLRLVMHHGIVDTGPHNSRLPVGRGWVAGRTVADRQPIQVPDLAVAGDEFPLGRMTAIRFGHRTSLGIPLLRSGVAIGCLLLRRKVVRPFDEKQITVLQTFADQAVIAIENARLFEAEQASKRELQARTRELQESLEYQTATSEVLSVISKSPNDLQPVLDAIVATAHRLCQAEYTLFSKREDDGLYHIKASVSADPGFVEWVRTHPIATGEGSMVGLVAAGKETMHFPDCLAEPRFTDLERQEQSKARTMLGVPLLRENGVIGVIFLARTVVQPFMDRQIALVTTFADQAVIAIENTRLFEAEQASKRELTEALEQQTATSDVLRVIGSSPTNVQPVFDTLAENAVRLCSAERAFISRFDGEVLRVVASHNALAEHISFLEHNPFVPGGQTATGRAAIERRTIHIHDVLADPEYTYGAQQIDPYRTVLAIPMLTAGKLLGVIVIYRHEVQPFTHNQIALMETFADQAVIAIENAHLFEEVQARTRELTESLEQQTATADVLKVISRSALDVQKVLDALVESAARLCDAYDAAIFQVFGDSLRLVAHHGQIPMAGPVGQLTRSLVRGFIVGRAVIERRTIHVADILAEGDEYPEGRKNALQLGFRTSLAVPLVHAGVAIGVIVIRRTEVRPFTERQIELVNTFADQAVIAIENTRLFEEVQARTRELAKTVEDLEIASQHKNQFVANMSHELRTPLAAILGYAELIQEGFYGVLPEKSLDALTRIRSNGKHLLGLINTVLDIAKIESGQFTLNMTEYAIESVVETVRAATESLAQNKKLTLTTFVNKSLPVGLGDEQRLTQVLLNLVGNAIKFTDAGEVSIAAGARNGHFAVSVTDTGPGIPLDQQDRIFDQFHQVDSSLTKAKGGTGLGLAIAKQIVEMHGGRIWVVSTPGKGSTFQMELPTRAELRKTAM
jgi:signal transduction histidine kinase